jgi:hypothetical protein
MSAPVTTRPFAYNAGGTISGTEQVGSLAIGTTQQDYSLNPGGVTWWNGPDENIGYVIAYPDSSGTHPTEIPGVTASLGFIRSSAKTDESFLSLFNSSFNQSLNDPAAAKLWLNNNGFWTSYGTGEGVYYLAAVYFPAVDPGLITFPDHSDSTGSTNPNLVGVITGSHSVQMYINVFDSAGNDNSIQFGSLVNNQGTLTLTQGSNYVTYAFTNTAFIVDNFGGGSSILIADNGYSTTPGSISVLKPATSDFTTTDPITVSSTNTPDSYKFTINSSMLDGLASAGNSQYGSANGTTGFTISNQRNTLPDGVYGTLNDFSGIESAYSAAGATTGYQGYIVQAQWGPGSTYPEGLAKISYNSGSHQFFVTAVDSANNIFTQQNTNNGANLVGTFNFPATFTFITPLIQKSDWC